MAERIFDFLASIKLAVPIILAIGILSAVGTIYEARFDAEVAQKLIYKSIYMYVTLGALAVNLIAVMIDRWPWRRHHTPFLLAHVGILLLLAGSFITQRFGLDGSMSFSIGETNSRVVIPETEFAVYVSNSENMTQLFNKPVDFFLEPPSKIQYREMVGNDPLDVVDYMHYGIRQSEIVESDKDGDGPAIRLQLQGPNVKMTQWILKEPGQPFSEVELGPAKVILTEQEYKHKEGNALVIRPGPKKWNYEVYTSRLGGLSSKGSFQEGDKVSTGWMNIEMSVLRLLPKAREAVSYTRRERPSSRTRPAVKIRFRGEEHWVGLNSVLKLFSENAMIWVNFANRRVDVGIPLQLTRFDVGRYQGTKRASSYQSEVLAPGLGVVTISMNEPLKYKQYTFYQASFESDKETGEPTASILSVNHDPGLFLKYLGSFLIVFGSVLLFYFKTQFIKRKSSEAK